MPMLPASCWARACRSCSPHEQIPCDAGSHHARSHRSMPRRAAARLEFPRPDMDAILVVNAGSSSLKFQIFGIEGGKLERRIRGQIDGIGVRPRLKAASDVEVLVERTYGPEEVPDLPAAIGKTRKWLRTLSGFRLRAIGHRVVHGGPDYDRPV